MRKHYKIVSTPRFITFLVICALVIIYATAAVTGASDVQGLTEQKYTTVAVCEGDTLWDIAHEYGAPETDVRDTIDEICHINSITASSLKPGDILLVPEAL